MNDPEEDRNMNDNSNDKFTLPPPGKTSDNPEYNNKSKISKSNSEAKFNHSGVTQHGSHAQSGFYNSSDFSRRNYGDKVYDKQSASTLLHSINSYSIPKASRFNDGHVDNFNNGGVTLKSTLDKRGNDFGKISARKPMSHLIGSNNPGPGAYSLPSDFGTSSFDPKTKQIIKMGDKGKGKTFGLGLEAYKNSFTLGMNKNVAAESELKSKPGPGAYELPTTFGKTGKTAIMAFRHEENFRSMGPGPIYDPNFRLVENQRFNVQSQGRGGRYDFTKQAKGVPGPEYNIPSVFDKYHNVRDDEFMAKAKEHNKQFLAAKQPTQKESTAGTGILRSYN
jgi:hypothetical protein